MTNDKEEQAIINLMDKNMCEAIARMEAYMDRMREKQRDGTLSNEDRVNIQYIFDEYNKRLGDE